MKFTCSTTSLNKAIQTVQRAISSKPTAPIFSGIHIIAAENILYPLRFFPVSISLLPKIFCMCRPWT